MNDLDKIFKNISWILNCKLRIQIDVKNEKYTFFGFYSWRTAKKKAFCQIILLLQCYSDNFVA